MAGLSRTFLKLLASSHPHQARKNGPGPSIDVEDSAGPILSSPLVDLKGQVNPDHSDASIIPDLEALHASVQRASRAREPLDSLGNNALGYAAVCSAVLLQAAEVKDACDYWTPDASNPNVTQEDYKRAFGDGHIGSSYIQHTIETAISNFHQDGAEAFAQSQHMHTGFTGGEGAATLSHLLLATASEGRAWRKKDQDQQHVCELYLTRARKDDTAEHRRTQDLIARRRALPSTGTTQEGTHLDLLKDATLDHLEQSRMWTSMYSSHPLCKAKKKGEAWAKKQYSAWHGFWDKHASDTAVSAIGLDDLDPKVRDSVVAVCDDFDRAIRRIAFSSVVEHWYSAMKQWGSMSEASRDANRLIGVMAARPESSPSIDQATDNMESRLSATYGPIYSAAAIRQGKQLRHAVSDVRAQLWAENMSKYYDAIGEKGSIEDLQRLNSAIASSQRRAWTSTGSQPASHHYIRGANPSSSIRVSPPLT